MELLTSCIGPVVSFTGPRIGRHISYVRNARKNVEDMNKSQALTLLIDKKSGVEKALEDAKMENARATEEVKHWLEKVAKLEGRVEAVKAVYEPIGRRHPLHNFILPTSWPSIYRCGRRAANFPKEAEEMLHAGEEIEQSLKNVADMDHTMTRLRVNKNVTEKTLEDAERRREQPTEEALLWFAEVAKLEADVDSVNANCEQIGPHHPHHTMPSIHSCGSRAASFKDKAAELLERARTIALTAPMGPDRVQRIAGPSGYVGKAIERNLERILDYLRDETVGLIGIWGPGGVGKTTLLGRINNSGDGNLEFDYVIWVVASQTLQVEKLQEAIVKRLELSSPSQIFDFLKDKNFLLLLDDLWEEFNLNDIGIPQPLRNSDESQRKQKVILTTRSEGVCSSMHVNKKIRVECLERDEALQLFREKVGERIISDPEIETLAKEVAEECDGLPIALITVGKAMSNKRTVREWKDALRKLQLHSGDIRGMDRVFSRLKISYDSLEDDTEKECFLYCSLCPEDYEIEEEELIWCWVGHGLIDLEKFDNRESAFDHAYSIIGNLKEACLLEAGSKGREGTIKMHDIIRDLAVRVVWENKWKWIVKTFNNAEKAEQAVAEWKDADKAYFGMHAYEDGDLIVQPPQCSKLSTLILQYRGGCVNADFLCLLPALRYLYLSFSSIKELPAVIGCLSQLEYLRIRCREMSGGLPHELANLSKLKYLLWEGPISIPVRVILKLQKLLVLVAEGVVQTNEDPTEEYDVEEFSRALRRMKFVEIEELKISSLGALELLSHVEVSKLHISNLRTLKTFHPQVLSNVKRQIESLKITNCAALEEFVMDSSCLPSLYSLTLKKLPRLREIIGSWVPGLPRLTVKINDCPEFEKARKNRRPASSGGAGSSGTENTVGHSNSPPSTLSTHTPGDGVSMAGDLQHISSMPKSLIKYHTDGTRGLASSSNQMDDSEHFGDAGSLDDNVESFMSHDDGETLRRGPAEQNTDSLKGFTFAEVGCISRDDWIGCCNFSSDGKVLAFGGKEGKVVLWNMDNMQTESSWEGHSADVTDICFRLNSTELATSSQDGTVRLWNAAEPTFYLHEFTGHGKPVMSLDFHPKETELLCSCDCRGEIRIWDVDQLLCSRVSKVKGGGWRVRFQPRIGQLLAVAIGNEVSIIDVETDMKTRSLQGPEYDVLCVCWDANGDYLASVSNDCVKVWSLTSGECIHELSSSNGDVLWSCVFHPRYPELLVVGGHESLQLWNMAENRTMLTVQPRDHVIEALAQTPFGGGTVASASDDGTVKIWR